MKNNMGSAMVNNMNKPIPTMINSVIPNELIMHSMSNRWIYPGMLMLRPTGIAGCFTIRDVPCRIAGKLDAEIQPKD